ncbi:MAG: hypothetical protein KGJ80_16330, partial [Chloroflexota bacterium]|nr:hypothetical protein [Chloroflexota bacterium]
VYLPAWTFDVSGEVTWNCLVEENDLWQPQSGSEVVYENDLRVAASHSLSAALTDEIDNFPLDRLVPFNPSYLADWLAETYQITVSGASLVARSRLLAKTQSQIQAGIAGTFKDLQLNPAHLVFESYKLVLVPLWIAHYRYEKVWRTVVVNGQQGTVRGEKPLKGVRKVLSGMLGGP